MKMNWPLRILLLVLLALAISAAGALAEEQLFTDRVELFSEGSFEPQPYVRAKSPDGFDAYIIEALNAQTERILVADFGMAPEEFVSEYRRVLNENPELFFVSGGFSYSYSGQIVLAVMPQYTYRGDELKEMQAIFRSGLNAIVNYARKADTTVGRLIRANDYICANYEYDLSYSIYSPEQMFKNKKGVCQAYMLVYQAVCKKLGIPNISVSSSAMNHTWNMVKVGSAWYHVDVTWNDPISDVPQRAMHDNFLLSDAGITAERHHSWNGDVSASSTKYDSYWWRNECQALPMNGDLAYRFSDDRMRILAYDFRTGSTQTVTGIDYVGFDRINAYSLYVYGDVFYFASGNRLYAMPFSSDIPTLVWTADASGSIWYPFMKNGKLHLMVSDNPYYYGTIRTVELIRPNYALTVTPNPTVLGVGEAVQLTASIAPELLEEYVLTWQSTDPAVARVDADGCLRAVQPGRTQVIVTLDDACTASCDVLVMAEELLTLPEDATSIGEEAFAGAVLQGVVLPEGVRTIASRAFADNAELMHVNIPSGVKSIAADAFDGCPNVVLLCVAGTCGEDFARAQELDFLIVP